MSGRISAIGYVEQAAYPVGWSFDTHKHDCYHMFCVLEGTLELHIGGKICRAEAGTGFLVPPQVLHGMHKQENSNQLVIEIMFETAHMPDGELQSLEYVVKLDETATECLKKVALFANSREEHLRSRAYRYLDTALTQICTLTETLDPVRLNAQFVDMTGLSDVTKSVIIYIDKHYGEQFTLEDMGKELGYNKSYLCTVFKADTGTTINDYLNLVRITHFAQYYSYQSEDIAKICAYCGFTSASHFNRTFKKFLGTTPTNYKKIRYHNFNTDVLTSDLRNQEDNYYKVKGILERTCTPQK